VNCDENDCQDWPFQPVMPETIAGKGIINQVDEMRWNQWATYSDSMDINDWILHLATGIGKK